MSIDAKQRLQDLGIDFSEANLLEYARKGDEKIVDLLLEAGIRPIAIGTDGRSAITIATLAGHSSIVRKLLERGVPLDDFVNTIHIRSERKDFWEKLSSASAIATIISSLIIAGVGWWFTNSYNRAQTSAQTQQNDIANHLKELEVVEKMIPHLAAEDSRQAALVAIEALTDKTLSTRLAELYKGSGSVRYLQELILSSNISDHDKTAALIAIVHVLDEYRPSIVKLSYTNKEDRGKYLVGGFVAATSKDRSIIATADYAVGVPPFTVQLFDGSQHAANFLKKEGGFAFFSVDVGDLKPRDAAMTQPTVGMRIVGVGFLNNSTDLQVQLGTILSISENEFVASYDGNARLLPGFGGSPFLDSQGQVLGIARSHEGENKHIVTRYLKMPSTLPAN
jgi:hypothetical protein